MDRQKLEKLTMTELRAEARRRGLRGADKMRRAELVAELMTSAGSARKSAAEGKKGAGAAQKRAATDSTGLIGRARQLVKRATERAAEKIRGAEAAPTPGGRPSASASRKTVPGKTSAKAAVATATPGATPAAAGAAAGASTPPETETLARLYEEQGHRTEALAIYRKILAQHPERTDLAEHVRTLEAPPEPAPDQPPQSPPADEVYRPHLSQPPEPFGMLDFEEPPETYGSDDVMVMAKDPWWMFVYWEVTGQGRASARSQLGGEGHGARLILRIAATAAGGTLETRDVELDWDHGRRYLPSPRPGARVTVAVGLRAPSGAFAPIAHSGTLLVPPAEPSMPGPVEWMEVVPPKRRGAEFEPIVVMTRGKERPGRGASRWEQGSWLRPGASVPLGEFEEPLREGESRGPSSVVRYPGSSNYRPRGGQK